DVMMPEMNGVAVLDAVRNDPELATVRFIFLTASADAEDVQRGLSRGANEYVTKPFNLKDLRVIIARHLGEGAV
ncbi:MAG TPA: response regulator, partial [Rhodocyclaceae bacterium]|nr:response regulator [Rhodocyclaceae bacterium]